MHLKVRSRVLNVMRHLTGSQCSSKSMGVTWSRFDRISITRAQAFWTRCSFSTTATDSPFRRLLQQSIRDITRACTIAVLGVLDLDSDECVQCCGDGSMLFWKCLSRVAQGTYCNRMSLPNFWRACWVSRWCYRFLHFREEGVGVMIWDG